MKKVIALVAFLVITAVTAYAQTDSTTVAVPTARELYPDGVKVPRYKLYPTENMWIHLKLDTARGKVWMVQYSVKDDVSRAEFAINIFPYSYDEDAVPGRYELYPTKNMYNFIMLDTIDGSTYQVQWSTDGKEGIVTIKNNK